MKYTLILFLYLVSLSAFADEMNLRDFDSLEAYEEYLQNNQQNCLDNSGGGSRATSCFSAYFSAWDDELNYYYNLLRLELDEGEREKLRQAQLSWIENRDTAREFNSALLDRYYANRQGTMFIAIRSGHASRLMSPITRNRTLLIKQWYEDVLKYK